MDEPVVPWWLIVLLSVTISSLSVWQSTVWGRRSRLAAAGMSLLYLVLLASAIVGTSRPKGTQQAIWPTDVLLTLSGCICLIAAICLLARPPWRGQLVWFGLLAVGVCGVSLAMRSPDVASASMVVALMTLIWNWKRPPTFRLNDLFPRCGKGTSGQPLHIVILTGATGFLTAILIIGTIFYVTRVEMHRMTATRRHTAVPSRERVHSIIPPDTDGRTDDLAFGRRSDVAILLAVLSFITLAAAMPVARKRTAESPT